MKLFIDTADLNEIKELASWGILDGVTTNPTLLAKSGRSFQEVIDEIFDLVDGPISLEVLSEKADDMIKEAKQIISKIPQKYRKNVAIKIPMTPEGLKAVKALSKEGIKTNVTLIFSANQALLAAKAGATFVSPFIGRLDDNGQEGMQLIEEIMDIFCNYDIETEVIVASIRHPIHVIEAARLGADIATVPPDVIRKMAKHPLTDAGIQSFLKDWAKVKK
ncbi:MAG: fructose-6-phosphate aldolase [Thermoplasmata archaeon]|jgi:transaldolase|nr:fructose-6-phosphate aldolase [Thermoplasmata archaeon]MBE3137005.1 fructose-6-phosphate aldolase [Thermoplasmata archaeon]MBE3139058.1 fructose-6-phosphate aldolase [Thermoplasmata archaeon]